MRQLDQGFVVPGRVLGLSIHAAVGSWGGVGRWLAALIVSLDVTIVNVALPTLVRQLGATTSDLRWVVDTDNLASPRWCWSPGARRTGEAARACWWLACLAGSLVASADQLIAARAVMALPVSSSRPAGSATASGTPPISWPTGGASPVVRARRSRGSPRWGRHGMAVAVDLVGGPGRARPGDRRAHRGAAPAIQPCRGPPRGARSGIQVRSAPQPAAGRSADELDSRPRGPLQMTSTV
jgi:hypothetical protein